jgi:nucleotide-binding universal stress UspA family protein
MFSKILLATDGSEFSHKAARHTAALAKATGAKVTLIHVSEPMNELAYIGLPGYELGVDRDQMEAFQRDISHRILERTGELLAAEGVNFTTKTEIGHPARTVVEIAEKEGFDLIVAGSSGHGQTGAIFLGSVSDRIAHRAHCPVLIVK